MPTETEIERLVVRLTGDSTKYQSMIQGVVKGTDTAAKHLNKSATDAEVFGRTIDNLGTKMSNFAGQMMAMSALQSPFSSLKEAVNLAAEAEETKVNIGTLLKSAEKGEEMFRKLKKFAAETPMTMPGILAGTQRLIQFGVEGEDVIPIMKRLGDVAMGNNDKFQRLTLAYGQMRTAQRFTIEESNQMREAGFDPITETADRLGISVAKLREDLSRGKVPFEELEKTLISATSAGGRFENGMLKASKTYKGLTSTMEDDLGSAKEAVGMAVIEYFYLKEITEKVSSVTQDLTERFNRLSPTVKGTIAVVTGLTTAMGTLVVVWKVTALTTGILVGVFRDIVITTKWVTLSTWDFIKALRVKQIVVERDIMGTVIQTRTNWSAVIAAKALTVAYGGLAAAIALGMVRAVMELDGSNRKLNKSLEEGQRLSENRLKQMQGQYSREMDSVKSLTDQAKKQEELNKIQEDAEKQVKALEAAQKSLDKEIQATVRSSTIEEYFGTIPANIQQSISELGKYQIGGLIGLGGEAKEEEQKTKDLNDALAEQRKRLEEVTEERRKLADDKANQKILGDADALIAKIKEQNETYGMSALQIEAMKLQQRGLNDEKQAEIQFLLSEAESLKEAEGNRKNLMKMTDDLQRSTQEWGKSESELFQKQLLMNNATQDQIQYLTRLNDNLIALKYQADAMERGKKVTEQFLTPQQKLARTNAELSELLIAGAISADTYDKAMAKAAESTERLAKATKDFADADSLEALSRVRDYQEMVSGWGVKGGPSVKPVETVSMPREVQEQDTKALSFWGRIAAATEAMAEAANRDDGLSLSDTLGVIA